MRIYQTPEAIFGEVREKLVLKPRYSLDFKRQPCQSLKLVDFDRGLAMEMIDRGRLPFWSDR
jgi:hypothetical protein